MKLIALALLFAPLLALAGHGIPDASSDDRRADNLPAPRVVAANAGASRTVCAGARPCAPRPGFASWFPRSPPFEPAIGWMPYPSRMQGRALGASHDPIRRQYRADAPTSSLPAIRGDGGSSRDTAGEGFASGLHLLLRTSREQPVRGGVAYTFSGKEYIAIGRWRRRPALVMVFALP